MEYVEGQMVWYQILGRMSHVHWIEVEELLGEEGREELAAARLQAEADRLVAAQGPEAVDEFGARLRRAAEA